MQSHNTGMKSNLETVSAPAEESQGTNSLVRFWLCFLLTLAALGLISGFLLFGLFLIMGYRIF
jgi:hypothetical protein